VLPELEEKQIFDGEKANLLVRDLRNCFDSGRTKSYEWRVSQLEAIFKLLKENEKEITEALYKDLAKPQFEAFVSEVFNFLLLLCISLWNSLHLLFLHSLVMFPFNVSICPVVLSASLSSWSHQICYVS